MGCSGCLDGDNQVLWKSDTHFITEEGDINRYRETAHIPEPCGHYCCGIGKGHCTRFLGSFPQTLWKLRDARPLTNPDVPGDLIYR